MLGCSTASFFGRVNTEDAIAEIAELGFQNCEVFLNTFSEYRPDFVEEIGSRIDKHGLCVDSVHALPTEFEPQLFVGTDRQKEDAFALLEQILQGAKRLGARMYVMHGKAMIHKNEDPLQKIAAFAQGFERIVELGKRYDILVTLENVHWAMGNSPEFIRQIASICPQLRFTLDVKQAILSGYQTQDYIDAMGERLCHLHLCDVDEMLQTCLPGQGVIDFKKLKQSLDAIGYRGNAIFEIYQKNVQSQDQLEQSIAFCRKIFD